MSKLSLKQLARGRLKAFQNAVDLIDDAECLFKRGRWARAAFLSHIAIEELGKYLIIMGAIGNLILERSDWRKFWKRFLSHKAKSENIFYFDATLSLSQKDEEILRDLEKARRDCIKFQKDKLTFLYTDFQDNKFVRPMDIVDKNTANKAIDNAKAVISFFDSREKKIYSKVNLDKMSKSKLKRVRDKMSMLWKLSGVNIGTEPNSL